jgi:hypothetical protein
MAKKTTTGATSPGLAALRVECSGPDPWRSGEEWANPVLVDAFKSAATTPADLGKPRFYPRLQFGFPYRLGRARLHLIAPVSQARRFAMEGQVRSSIVANRVEDSWRAIRRQQANHGQTHFRGRLPTDESFRACPVLASTEMPFAAVHESGCGPISDLSLKICFREIFGIVRFSTFAWATF